MKITVIIPSLDPDEKLLRVVDGMIAAGFEDIVLVNDGSSASHLQPFLDAAAHPEVTVLTHEVNRGKGRALKTAFSWCMDNRPQIGGVVTVDGDDQHSAKDVLACVRAMEREPEKVWLGVRDFSLEQVPWRSRLGNTITRSVMKLACGVRVTDTQTGLRAIPARYLPLMCRIDGERYEYETQMLLSLRTSRIGIGEVVIDTVYIDQNQASHFDTVKDSWKIYRIIFRHILRSLRSFAAFAASSIACFLLDNGLFTLLNAAVLRSVADGGRELASTLGARVVSSVVNFLLNRNLVFRSRSAAGRSAGRYFLLAAVQCGASALLVYLINALLGGSNVMETAIKIPVDALLFLASYFIQKRWVFRDSGPGGEGERTEKK